MLVVFGRQMFQKMRDISPLETMAYTVFGLLYVPWMFSFVTKIIFLLPRDAVTGHVTGHWYVLWLIVVTKFSDMGAYVTGSVIGKHPLIPHISPKKTWEGFFGAIAFSVGGACGMLALIPQKLPILDQGDAVVLGIGLGFAAIIGDLAESIIKRNCDVKDSGSMLPGIGGALDLIDSILFTAPLLFFYLRFVEDGPMRKRRLVILGSTGSIGESALKVARDIPERIEVVGIAAQSQRGEIRCSGRGVWSRGRGDVRSECRRGGAADSGLRIGNKGGESRQRSSWEKRDCANWRDCPRRIWCSFPSSAPAGCGRLWRRSKPGRTSRWRARKSSSWPASR